MPSIFGHALVPIALGTWLPHESKTKIVLLGVVCSILPDADVAAFPLGIPYEHLLGHRGFSHSILFALVIAFLLLLPFWANTSINKINLWLYFFACTLSHALLDSLTSGGLGVALFAPFDENRYFAPFRPIRVSPIGLGFFSFRGLQVLLSEFFWIGGLASIIWVTGKIRGKKVEG